MEMTPKFKTYPKYKSSGVEWLGSIPEHWEVIKLGRIGKFTSSGIDKILINNEPKVKIINYTDIYGNENHIIDSKIDFMVVTAPKSKIKQHQVKIGDLIFTPSSETIEDIGVSAVVVEQLENTAFSYHVLRFQFHFEIFLNYKKYLCNNSFVLNQFSTKAQGTTRQTLDRNDFKTNQVILPPLPEQEAIAKFLDEKTEKIDRAIKQKEQMIELLKERKQIIIQDAVTKGLNPKVAMKDSGVEWIGEIPEHWEVKRLGSILTNVSIKSKPNLQLLSITREKGVIIRDIEDLDSNHNFIPDDLSNYKIIEKGQFGMNKMKAWQGSYGISQYNGIVSPAYYIFKFVIDMLGSFFNYSIRTKLYVSFFASASDGVRIGQWDLSKQRMNNIPFLIPPISEQELIVEHIEEQSSKIDKAIKLQERQIDKLKEYKSILIDNAVTGKIKVV